MTQRTLKVKKNIRHFKVYRPLKNKIESGRIKLVI